MIKNLMSKKEVLMVGGAIIIAVVMACLVFYNINALATGGSQNNISPTDTIPLDADQDDDEVSNYRDTRMRWNGEKWEYSTDGGQTWTDTPPDGVQVDQDGNVWLGDGNIEDFDFDAYMENIDDMINSIMSDIYDRYGDLIPEDAESGSFFTYGDTIARKVDGVWEFSSDGGNTWTNEPPEGIEVSEDGTRFRIGGEGNINDFDEEAWLKEWYNKWQDYFENNGGNNETRYNNVA